MVEEKNQAFADEYFSFFFFSFTTSAVRFPIFEFKTQIWQNMTICGYTKGGARWIINVTFFSYLFFFFSLLSFYRVVFAHTEEKKLDIRFNNPLFYSTKKKSLRQVLIICLDDSWKIVVKIELKEKCSLK